VSRNAGLRSKRRLHIQLCTRPRPTFRKDSARWRRGPSNTTAKRPVVTTSPKTRCFSSTVCRERRGRCWRTPVVPADHLRQCLRNPPPRSVSPPCAPKTMHKLLRDQAITNFTLPPNMEPVFHFCSWTDGPMRHLFSVHVCVHVLQDGASITAQKDDCTRSLDMRGGETLSMSCSVRCLFS